MSAVATVREERTTRFGARALEARLVTREALDECLHEQERRRARKGRSPRIGELLVHRGHLEVEDVRRLLGEEQREARARTTTRQRSTRRGSRAFETAMKTVVAEIETRRRSAASAPVSRSKVRPGARWPSWAVAVAALGPALLPAAWVVLRFRDVASRREAERPRAALEAPGEPRPTPAPAPVRPAAAPASDAPAPGELRCFAEPDRVLRVAGRTGAAPGTAVCVETSFGSRAIEALTAWSIVGPHGGVDVRLASAGDALRQGVYHVRLAFVGGLEPVDLLVRVGSLAGEVEERRRELAGLRASLDLVRSAVEEAERRPGRARVEELLRQLAATAEPGRAASPFHLAREAEELDRLVGVAIGHVQLVAGARHGLLLTDDPDESRAWIRSGAAALEARLAGAAEATSLRAALERARDAELDELARGLLALVRLAIDAREAEAGAAPLRAEAREASERIELVRGRIERLRAAMPERDPTLDGLERVLAPAARLVASIGHGEDPRASAGEIREALRAAGSPEGTALDDELAALTSP